MQCVSGSAMPPARGSRELSAGSWALAAALLIGCARSSPAAKSEQATLAVAPATTAAPAAPGAARAKWRVCTTGDYAPFSTRDSGGQLHGFDIDIARALAQDSGVEL